MSEMIDARVVLCKCPETGKLYGVRFEKTNIGWKYTWAFPIKDKTAKREGYDETQIIGAITPDDNYPGCPYCGAKHFVICNCGKLSCNVGNPNFTCLWCGEKGTLSGSYDGSGISSSSDI